ncbi:MAG: glycosyltransferase [Acidimicrobiales bacterium]
MRVLVVHNRYRSALPSGEDRVVDQESAALAQAGCIVERFERRSDEIGELSLAGRASLPGRVVWNPEAGRALRRAIEGFGPDVVHVHNVYPLLSPSVLAAGRGRVPVVVTFHNYRPLCPTGEMYRDGKVCTECVGTAPAGAVLHGCYRGSRVQSLPLAAATVVQRHLVRAGPAAYLFLSEAQRASFAGLGLPLERCFVKPNLVHPSPHRRRPEPLIAFVGRLDEPKGIRFLIQGWDRLRSGGEEGGLRLVVAGSGPLEPEVRAWAAGRARVEVLGLLSREGCAELMATARAVVVPSVWPEPFGLVVAEAMAAGAPPIAPDHAAFPELIRDGVDGALYPSGDVEGLTRLLRRAELEPNWFEKLGKEAKSSHARRFSPAVVVDELLAVYRFAVEHPSSAAPAIAEPSLQGSGACA